jgi:GntR family transcriptional regulator
MEHPVGKIDPKSLQPLYKQLYQIIINDINNGVYHPGDKLPSEDALQEKFGVSRVTVRKAIQVLVEDEMLLRIHGKGTFVTEGRFSETIFSGGSFTDTCLRMGVTPKTHVLCREIQRAKQRIAKKLSIETGAEIIYIQRLRQIDGVPCILEQDYFPLTLRFLLDVEIENKSIFGIIKEKIGLLPKIFEDHFEVRYAAKDEAKLLECEPDTALLRVDQMISKNGFGILYYNEQLIRSDRYTYAVRYRGGPYPARGEVRRT